NIAEMSALGLPQIAVVMGQCTGRGAYIPAMCDEPIIVRESATVYLGSPQLVQAATGEVVHEQRLGGADVHTRLSATADHFAQNDIHAITMAREIVARTHPGKLPTAPSKPQPPLYDPSEIPGIISANPREPIPAREILARLLDG